MQFSIGYQGLKGGKVKYKTFDLDLSEEEVVKNIISHDLKSIKKLVETSISYNKWLEIGWTAPKITPPTISMHEPDKNFYWLYRGTYWVKGSLKARKILDPAVIKALLKLSDEQICPYCASFTISIISNEGGVKTFNCLNCDKKHKRSYIKGE